MMMIDVCFKSSEGLQNLLREEEAISQLLRRCSLLRKVFLKMVILLAIFAVYTEKYGIWLYLKKLLQGYYPLAIKSSLKSQCFR